MDKLPEMARLSVLLVAIALALTGCGEASSSSPSSGTRDDVGTEKAGPSTEPGASPSASADAGLTEAQARLSGACTDRLLADVDPDDFPDADQKAIRAYIQGMYCDEFAREGAVYEDGTLSIEAHHLVLAWYVSSQECMEATVPGGEPREIPCEGDMAAEPTECSILRYVRRSEVEAYLDETGVEECMDGTPLDELGVPD